jgi:excinuclease ABC subunit C
VLQNQVAEAEVIESWLREKRRGQKFALNVPSRGKGKKLVDLVASNAAEVLAQMRAKWMADEKKASAALDQLADALDLDEPPARIECYDISNIQGTSQVGSMVVFENGQSANGAYRRFQIKAGDGANDFASLQEILKRRFGRAGQAGKEENVSKGWTKLPDLVIIDGGKGQLNAALETMQKLGLERIPVVSLAKQNEEIFTPTSSEPVMLPRDSQALYLVQRIRDEAHRFAVTYHRQVRGRSSIRSQLDEIPGIGPTRKSALLKRFGSVQKIREASLDDLAATVGSATATTLKERL